MAKDLFGQEIDEQSDDHIFEIWDSQYKEDMSTHYWGGLITGSICGLLAGGLTTILMKAFGYL